MAKQPIPAFIERAFFIGRSWVSGGDGFTLRVVLTNGETIDSPPPEGNPLTPGEGFLEFDTADGTRLVPFDAVFTIEAVYVAGRSTAEGR